MCMHEFLYEVCIRVASIILIFNWCGIFTLEHSEQITIPPEKPYIYLKGEGIGKTNVVSSSNGSIATSATFFSCANNTVVSDITFVVRSFKIIKIKFHFWAFLFELMEALRPCHIKPKFYFFIFHLQNSYNYPFKKDGNIISPAVAAMISGDKSAFYRCSFLGLQDTLLDEKGRHYFKLCTFEGAIDFIFGSGQSIYEVFNLSF